MKERIYVCHTYYHVYIAILKELNLGVDHRGEATILLSKLSTDFEQLNERILATGIFEAVMEYDEKGEFFFPELQKYREDKGNLLFNLISRIRFTKKYAKLNETYVPVEFKNYKNIYVFCDSDPIGYYLNWKHISYHALEDGLNCIVNFDAARYDNRGHFKLKAFLSEKLNLIFVQNGYGRYCLDMEVNDIKAIAHPCRKYIEEPRHLLVERLTREDKDCILGVFVRDKITLERQIERDVHTKDKILILTEPLCDMQTRERIFRDLVAKYQSEGIVYLKPHPRDALDYRSLMADIPQFDATIPMEVLNLFPRLHFSKVISVLTDIHAICFADECIRLGPDFMDEYEEPSLHRQNEQIDG